MKEKLGHYIADSTTSFTAGVGASAVSDGKHELLVLFITLIAPLLRDAFIKITDKLLERWKNNASAAEAK